MLSALLTILLASPPTPDAGASSAPKGMELEQFQLVMLVRGPKWTAQETPELAELMKNHLAYVLALMASGKALVAGPFDGQPDPNLNGMYLFRVGSPDEARRLAEEDPAVKAGHFKTVAMTWFVEKGRMAFPRSSPVPERPR